MTRIFATIVALLSLAAADATLALSVGQTDDFQNGTTQGWTSGVSNPFPPITVLDGGPAGADDAYLLMRSTGTPVAGGRLVGFNVDQWAGDYTSVGVASIKMEVFNFGPSDLSLRLMFMDPITGPPTNVAVSTDAVFLPVGGGWTPVTFPVLASDLTALNGDASAVLSNTTVLRLFHGIDTGVPPEPISAMLGIDNICALGADSDATACRSGGTPVPEPGALGLLGVGLLGLMAGRRPSGRSRTVHRMSAIRPPVAERHRT
jgi:hypothetical protein